MIYLAQPYSHPKRVVREHRYECAMQACGQLFLRRRHVYSPIVHWHNVAEFCELPTDYSAWMHENHYMLARSSIVCVLTLEGWKESHGLFHELKYAEKIGRTVFTIDQEDHFHTEMVTVRKLLREMKIDGEDNKEPRFDGGKVTELKSK